NITKALTRVGEQLKKQRLLKEEIAESQAKKDEAPVVKEAIMPKQEEAVKEDEKPTKKQDEKSKKTKTRRPSK
ncbi:MAG: hypothetical protein N2596_05810, partial [Syntrophorhabdaceae bacterium]|nr:hypothetical protein [Syntrophorhabdaceae bacterium]